jgi:hypothetical protein
MDPEDLDLDDTPPGDLVPIRLDLEWTVASAIRDLLGVALKGIQEPTYAQALALGREIAPSLLGEGSLLGEQAEQADVRLYRERAESESALRNREVTPDELVGADIAQYGTVRGHR